MNWSFVKIHKTFLLLGIFGIAMGVLEAIVVVYLRQIYYPKGFDFPLSFISPKMVSIEWIREVSTIIMLVVIGIIAGKNILQRFFYFLYSFAIWDIFYYAGLKLILDWPQSFLTWDILFLIPVPWISPVLAPVICSLTIILFSGSMIFLQERGYTLRIKPYEWGLTLFGSFVILCSFIWDYCKIIIQNDFLSSLRNLSGNKDFWLIFSQYNPTYYNWYMFAFGEILILCALFLVFTRTNPKYAKHAG